MSLLGASGPIGLVAGQGDLPVIFAQAARSASRPVIVFGIEGVTDKRIETFGIETLYVPWGDLGRLFELIRSKSVKKLVLAGAIPKKRIYDPAMNLDQTARDFLGKTPNKGDDHLLRSLAVLFKLKSGASVVDSRMFLKDQLAPKGALTRRTPTENEWKDIRLGFRAAKHIGRMDVGQTLLVKDGVIVAVEGLEGTDQAIRRAGQLAGSGCVVVKVSKPGQSLRFDLPCAGETTLESMRAASAGVLAVEAGKTLLISKGSFTESADKSGLCVVGL